MRPQKGIRRYIGVAGLLFSLLMAACASQQATTPASTPTQAPAPQKAADTAPKKPVPIRVGHGFAAEEQLWLMKARADLTPNQGKVYTLEYTPFRGGTDRTRAFQAGELDAGTTTGDTALFAFAQGIDFRLVASISREATQGFKSSYLVLDDSPIKKVADLKGKTIGIVDYRSSTDYWARAAVKKAGLDPEKDVKYVVVPFPAMGDSVRSKKIDAGTFVQPFYSMELAKGGLRKLFDAKYGVPFDQELMVVWFGADFISKHRDVVKAFVDDYRKVNDYYIKNNADAKKALVDAKFVALPVEAYQAQEDWFRAPDPRVDMEAMGKTLDGMVELGWIEKKYDFSKFIDNSFHP